MRSDQTTGREESRTAHDSGGEWALGEGESPGRGAPHKGGGSTLEEHCPGGAAEIGWRGEVVDGEFGGLRLREV